MLRRQFISISAAGALLPIAGTYSQAHATVITKPSRLVVGFTAGGGTDTIARMVADALRPDYPGGMIVENKPGAASRIAVETVKASEPDGSTLLVTPDFPLTVYPHSFPKLSYDPLKDLVPVAPICIAGMALCVGPAVPASVKTAAEFMDWCKANPKQAVFGSPGPGSSFHFAGLMLGKVRGVDMTHIGYKGGAPALQDVVGGQIPSVVTSVGEASPFVKAGRLRILATFGAERDRFAPDAPTMVESGFKDVTAQAWVGVLAPAKTPADVVNRTMLAVNRAVASSALAERLAGYSMRPLMMNTTQFDAMLRSDIDRWGPVVKASGFKAED